MSYGHRRKKAQVEVVPGSVFGRGMVPRFEVFVDGEQVGFFTEEGEDFTYDPPEVVVTYYSADPYDTVVVADREAAIGWLVMREAERQSG